MELNEVTRKLPKHLLQFVVDQPYNEYSPVDQAVWRYVMRQNKFHLKKVAHESYVRGLEMTGVGTEQIPTMYGMNRILKDIGWAAVAVDGFIPPGAFMEFTKYNVLVIAADIRTLEHIEYTPAPDVIHESAGHAPILAMPEFATYLKRIGEAGSKAFSSQKDVELYEAIRHLSIIKEDPATEEKDIHEAEDAIDYLQKHMGPPSELALIRNLHWWTVEYGLIGTVDNFRLYGAGLLSSIGEGMSCLSSKVKKIPYTVDAMHCNYDITKPQPQLFVTPDFEHLNRVLDEFTETMARSHGGLSGVEKAIASGQTGTIVFSSGLQVSGTFTEVIAEDGLPVFVRTSGPSAFAINDVQLKRFGKERLPDGFTSPAGKLMGLNKPIEEMTDEELAQNGMEPGKVVDLEFGGGIMVRGEVKEIFRGDNGKVMFLELRHAAIIRNGHKMMTVPDYLMAVGEKIVSAFAGPADIEAFEPTVIVPREKMHKIKHTARALRMHELYRTVRKARTNQGLVDQLPGVWEVIRKEFPEDWLLPMELLEILGKNDHYSEVHSEIQSYLEAKRKTAPHLENLISNGFKVLEAERTTQPTQGVR